MPKTSARRECQPCTACCDGWLQIRINDVPVYPGRPCPRSTGKGCNDYVNRPTHPCVQFECGWRGADSPLPDWMKPSNAKVIVLFDQYQWRGMPVDVAVPVGRRIPPRALNWLKKFAEVHGRPLLYAEQIVQDGSYVVKQRVAAYGPAEFQQEFTPAEIQQQPLSHDMPFGQQRRPATSIQTAQQPSFGE